MLSSPILAYQKVSPPMLARTCPQSLLVALDTSTLRKSPKKFATHYYLARILVLRIESTDDQNVRFAVQVLCYEQAEREK